MTEPVNVRGHRTSLVKAIKSNTGSHVYQDNETLTSEVNSATWRSG